MHTFEFILPLPCMQRAFNLSNPSYQPLEDLEQSQLHWLRMQHHSAGRGTESHPYSSRDSSTAFYGGSRQYSCNGCSRTGSSCTARLLLLSLCGLRLLLN